MRFCLSLLVLTCPASLLPAGPVEDARAKAALALALSSRAPKLSSACNCSGPADCTCPPGTCTCPNCAASAKRPDTKSKGSPYLIYSLAREAAMSQGRPMLVWVGTVCPSCEAKMMEYVHYRCSSFDGDSTPRVIVSVPKGGELYEAKVFTEALPSPDEVKAAIALWNNKYQRITAARAQAAQPAVAPQFFAPPPMMGGFGGFGGGMMGGCMSGGCGGGG